MTLDTMLVLGRCDSEDVTANELSDVLVSRFVIIVIRPSSEVGRDCVFARALLRDGIAIGCPTVADPTPFNRSSRIAPFVILDTVQSRAGSEAARSVVFAMSCFLIADSTSATELLDVTPGRAVTSNAYNVNSYSCSDPPGQGPKYCRDLAPPPLPSA